MDSGSAAKWIDIESIYTGLHDGIPAKDQGYGEGEIQTGGIQVKY